MEFRLVLESVQIPVRAELQSGWWVLLVPSDHWNAAAAELDAYTSENLSSDSVMPALPTVYPGGKTGAAVYAAVILMIGFLSLPGALGIDLYSAGNSQAGLVVAGQWWRTMTALTLHADFGHLASNLVFGVLFGILAGRALGGGVGWSGIVLAGTLGNLANALIQDADHRSIGASTAVFATLGILVALALRPRTQTRESLLRRWSPLIGGVMLLAFIGVGGERTDVMAHVTGFLAGLLVGWACRYLPVRWLGDGRVQFATAFATVAFVALAWVVALGTPHWFPLS